MSDTAHLLIPFASCDDAGCAQARSSLKLPALEKLLSRLEPDGSDEGDETTLSMPHERMLARDFGLPADDGSTPWAAWQLAQSGRDPGNAACAWITPCHWDVGRDHVSMAHPGDLALSAGQSQALVAALQPWFEQDAIALEYESPTLWVARGEVFRGLPTASLDRVSGGVIDRWMPRGDAGKAVRRLQQEMQMLLYTHQINDDRANAGLAPVNSFWVSGTGALPSGPRPQGRQELRVVHELRDAALRQDWPAWVSAWQRVDERDCGQLLAALDRGEQVALTLCGERNGRTFGGAGGGFFGKLRASLRPHRAAQVLESL